MVRSWYRKMIAAVIALCLIVSFAQGVQASPGLALAERTDSSWIEEAFAWLSRLIVGEPTESPIMTSTSANDATGSCIDPFGHPHCL